MSSTSNTTDSISDLRAVLRTGDAAALERFIEGMSPADTARTLSRLSDEDRALLMDLLSPEGAAEVIWDLPDAQAADLLEGIPAATAAAIMEEMDSDHRADVLGEIEEDAAEQILEMLPRKEAAEARRLMQYPEDAAGGIMVTEFLAYPKHFTVKMVLHDLQRNRVEYADYHVQYIYVTAENRRLIGVLRLRDLIMASGNEKVTDLMIPNPLSVPDTMSLEQLGEFFDEYDFFGVPVVGAHGELMGVVEAGDLRKAEGERDAESYMKSAGIMSGEELRSMPFVPRSRHRLGWLSLNILLNVISASVIAIYEETLAAVIALAVFLPIISDMSGNAGSQSVAVTMREITLGVARWRDVWRVMLSELYMGFVCGIVLGILIALTAWVWQGKPWLGAVVGVALFLNTIVGVCLGGTIPLLFKRLKMDPALASGPILTTITDMCGFFFVLGIATWALPYIS